jgi:hypothetical protein
VWRSGLDHLSVGCPWTSSSADGSGCHYEVLSDPITNASLKRCEHPGVLGTRKKPSAGRCCRIKMSVALRTLVRARWSDHGVALRGVTGGTVAGRKTVTRQTIIGEKGIALIERRCLEMGYLFHPRRVDHGIDGHIDLVDQDSGAVLNQTLLVQSKASDRPFAWETDQSLRFVCDDRDLDLWLAGNAPVILVLSHPEQDEAWWVDVKAAFPDAESRVSRGNDR